MPREAADWVYDVVLTQRFKESAGCIQWTGFRKTGTWRDEGPGAVMLRTCPCEYGLCGRCADGRPDRCAHREWTPPLVPAAYVQNRRGMAIAKVWRSGKPCTWLCPNVRLGQLELFAPAGGDR